MKQLITGLSTVRTAAYSKMKLRDLKNIDLIDRFENELASTPTVTLVWHKMCCVHFTDSSKVERLQKTRSDHCKEEAKESSGSYVYSVKTLT